MEQFRAESGDAPCLLYAGTEDGVRTYRVSDEGVAFVGAFLEGNAVRAIAPFPNNPRAAYVGCGLRGWGLHRIDVDTETVSTVGFEDRWVWDVTFAPDKPGTVYVGTEPPVLYVSRDDGSFESFDALEELPSRDRWLFFHEPFKAGHIHGLAIHSDRPESIYAGVEHGALVYTHDCGETWQEALVGHDIHRVEVDPADPDRVFAGAGGGLHISEDAGATWSLIEDVRGKYVHGIEFDHVNPERVYVYADASPPLYRSDDAGNTWTGIGDALAAARPSDNLQLHPDDPETIFYAPDSDDGSDIVVSTDAGATWQQLPVDAPKIWRLQVVPAQSA